jgi:hypothetical protein
MIKDLIFLFNPLIRQARNAICFVETSRRDVFLNNSDGSPIKNVGDDKGKILPLILAIKHMGVYCQSGNS